MSDARPILVTNDHIRSQIDTGRHEMSHAAKALSRSRQSGERVQFGPE